MTSAGGIVMAYLRTQGDVIAARADDVRADAPDAVHRSRVATRRSRSALRNFSALFHRSRLRRLRDELAWHADRLGAPRDAEVLKERLLDALAALPADEVIGPVAERLTAELDEAHAQAHLGLVASMSTSRYQDLREELADFLAHPPLKKKASKPADDVLPDLWRGAIDKVARLAERAADIPDDLHHWHEVRKAAKAARYCSEALVDGFGEQATERARAWEAVTEAFGEVQDTVVAEQALIRIAAGAREAGEPVDSYVALEAVELRQREQSLGAGRSALAAALALPGL